MRRSASRITLRSRALLLVAVAALPFACTSESGTWSPGGADEVVVWDFPLEPPAPSLRLWPEDAASPKRKKRALATSNEQGRLAALVDGADPGFSWDFESPVAASFVRVEVEALAPGRLQLFFATSRCPVFSEACSATANLVRGKNLVNFLLDPAFPLRALRLDPPDSPGARFWFDLMALRTGSATDSLWMARDTVSNLELTPTGLRLSATVTDPGMIVETPGLEASRVTAVELVLRGSPGGRPQLFWDGPCGSFSEACSATLPPADAGTLTHRAVLKKYGKWTGRIGALRLDPGPNAGEYVVQRIAFVHDPAD